MTRWSFKDRLSRVGALIALAMATSVAMTGCSVSPVQIYELTQQIIPTPQKREQAGRLKSAWTLHFASAEYPVWPTQQQDGSWVFSGTGKLRLVFDGLDITSIEGMPGGFGPVSVTKNGQIRLYRRGGRRSYSVTCAPPMEWRLATDRTGVRTECYGDLNGTRVFTHHSIEYDGSGDLREISSVIVPGAAPLVLRRTPGSN